MNYTNKVHDKLALLASLMLFNLVANVNRYKYIRIRIDKWKVRKKSRSN